VREGQDQLRCDLLQRILRVGKAELLAEQGGLGGAAVRGGDGREAEVGRVNQGLGLLNKRRQLEHGSGCG